MVILFNLEWKYMSNNFNSKENTIHKWGDSYSTNMKFNQSSKRITEGIA